MEGQGCQRTGRHIMSFQLYVVIDLAKQPAKQLMGRGELEGGAIIAAKPFGESRAHPFACAPPSSSRPTIHSPKNRDQRRMRRVPGSWRASRQGGAIGGLPGDHTHTPGRSDCQSSAVRIV